MAKKQSEFSPIGEVYALALYDSAVKSNQLVDVLADMQSLQEVLAKIPLLALVLKAATISGPAKLAVLEKVFATSINQLTLQTLRAMGRRDRLEYFPDFLQAMISVEQKRSNRVPIEVITAVPLDDAQRELIARRTGEALQQHVDLSANVNPQLIGGVQLRIGDLFIDGSVQRRLASMRQSLTHGLLVGMREKMPGMMPS